MDFCITGYRTWMEQPGNHRIVQLEGVVVNAGASRGVDARADAHRS